MSILGLWRCVWIIGGESDARPGYLHAWLSKADGSGWAALEYPCGTRPILESWSVSTQGR